MKVAVIGIGKVGSSILKNLPKNKYDVLGGLDVDETSAVLKAKSCGMKLLSRADLALKTEIVFLTVPDQQIAVAAKDLARFIKTNTTSIKYVFHCSGANQLDVLAPLSKLGITCGSIHPLQAFVDGNTSLEGIYMAIAGGTNALTKAQQIVQDLGGISFKVPMEARGTYHAAACICSNYTVTLTALAEQLMVPFMETRTDALKALIPLLKGTVANLEGVLEAKEALTGPIVRGDCLTIQKHLDKLPKEARGIYIALGKETLEIAPNISKNNKNNLEKMFQNT